MTPRLNRAVPALLLAAALLTACGDETTSDGSDREPDQTIASDDASPLTPRTASFAVFDDAAAELALLSQTNLGPAFQPDLDSADQVDDEATAEEVATGCDADTAFEDQFDATGLALGTADIDYLLIDDARLMVVTSDVRSFGDENTAQAAFDALYEAIGECTHFEAASEDGLESTVIDVAIDTETATEDVDDQFDMTGGGAWTFDGQEIPLGVGFSIARIDNNITMVMLLSIGVPEDSELLAPYTEIAADRLAAVMAGETPEEVAAPQPVAAPPVRAPIDPVPGTLADFYASAPGVLGDD